MSLFQCAKCGCVDNTSTGLDCFADFITDMYDWTGLEEYRGQNLCSACAPTKNEDGTQSEFTGEWTSGIDRTYLEKGKWKTNDDGNLEHIETGETNYRNYMLKS